MDVAVELGRNPVSKHQIQHKYVEMSRLTRDGTAEPVSRDQILRHERGQGNIHFSCSADHMQDWQPYPVDPCSCYMCDHTFIHEDRDGYSSIPNCRAIMLQRIVRSMAAILRSRIFRQSGAVS